MQRIRIIAPGNNTLFLKAEIPKRLGNSAGSAIKINKNEIEKDQGRKNGVSNFVLL